MIAALKKSDISDLMSNIYYKLIFEKSVFIDFNLSFLTCVR